MKTRANKEQKTVSQTVPSTTSKSNKTRSGKQSKATDNKLSNIIANSPLLTTQRKLQETIDSSPRLLKTFSHLSAQPGSPVQCATDDKELLQGKFLPLQRQTKPEEEELQAKFKPTPMKQDTQCKPNQTGLPDKLKTGIETLSGISMDNVRVHYNSSKPAQLNALAYAQGTDIHVSPGEQQHLPHEAWHVVQQAQGRVKPTKQMNDKIKVNDEHVLEREADEMGSKALQVQSDKNVNFDGINDPKSTITQNETRSVHGSFVQLLNRVIQLVTPLRNNMLNVVGEDHPETEAREPREKQYTAAYSGSTNYWTESEFRTRAYSIWTDLIIDRRARADPFELRFNHAQQFLANNAITIKNEGDANINTSSTLNHLNTQQKFIHNLWTYLDNLDSGFFKDQADGFEVPEARRTQMLGYRQQVKDIAVTWQTARVSLAATIHAAAPPNVFGWANGGVVVTSEANERANHKKSIDDLGQLNIVNQTAAQISQSRSGAMHTAANNRSGERGVWKIGDVHAGHMESMNPKTYNLVRLSIFNADYNTWNP